MDVSRLVDSLAGSGRMLAPRCVDESGHPVEELDAPGLFRSTGFTDLTYDSRACTDGALFICKGASFQEGFLDDARTRGACAYLSERPYPDHGLPGIVVDDVRRAMALAACEFFHNPSYSLDVVGITGTKGKTTVSFYLDAILRKRPGHRSGLIGGIHVDVGDGEHEAHNTTPESVELQRFLSQALANGCDTVAMEVSSQALKYDRTLGTRFAVGLFTNIGEDHISPIEHPSFDDYFSSKLRLFDQSDIAAVNLDAERAGDVLAAAGRCGKVLTYSTDDSTADIALISCERRAGGGYDLVVRMPDGACVDVAFGGLGLFNVSNALAAVAAAEALGVDRSLFEKSLDCVSVPGRMERYGRPDDPVVGIVDYAHNELSLTSLLGSVRDEYPDREVTVVFGSTGMKAQDRRAGLGRAAACGADRIILTEDEPGDVPVSHICAEIGREILARGRSYEVVEDRQEAIRKAVEGASHPAVVVLAGKGIENTMLRASGPEPYPTDAVILRRFLRAGSSSGICD